MQRFVILTALAGLWVAGPAGAYEYPLRFAPLGGAQGLMIAGYVFNGATVVGNCSYHVTRSSGGRGGHSTTTYYNQTCTWDLHGNLVKVVTGAPSVPTPLSSVNGLTIYARDKSGDTTGYDATHREGFVDERSAQYINLNPSGGYAFLGNQQPVPITLQFQSVGDIALLVKSVAITSTAKVTVKSSTCASVPVGASCTIVLTYDPSGIPGGDDPYTLYDHISVSLVSNSGLTPVFTETVEVPIAPGG